MKRILEIILIALLIAVPLFIAAKDGRRAITSLLWQPEVAKKPYRTFLKKEVSPFNLAFMIPKQNSRPQALSRLNRFLSPGLTMINRTCGRACKTSIKEIEFHL